MSAVHGQGRHRMSGHQRKTAAAVRCPADGGGGSTVGHADQATRSASPRVATGVAVVAASLIAATPLAVATEAETPTPLPQVSHAAVALAAASVLNIPANMLIDIANIPTYEVQAINYESAALMFTGSWWVSNATNIWGTDPADPPKYLGATMMLLPNPYFSAPIGATLTAMAIAELPVNSTCGTTICAPFVPWDSAGALRVALGLDPLPIVNNFFTVPLSELYTGYTYDPTAPGQQSFGGYVPTDPFGPEYPLAGTQTGPDGTYLMPWAGQTVNLTDVTSAAWTAYVNHLTADPSENPITIPSFQDVSRAVTNLVAGGIVDFDPFTPGMSYCPSCQWPSAITPEGIVGALSAADPGNTLLSGWLNNHGWQASQGAPGTPATPSTPESVEALDTSTKSKTAEPKVTAAVTDTAATDKAVTDTAVTDTAVTDTAADPSTAPDPASSKQGRHAKFNPLAAISADLTPKAATAGVTDGHKTTPTKTSLTGGSGGLASAASKLAGALKPGGGHSAATDSGSATSGRHAKSVSSAKSGDTGKK